MVSISSFPSPSEGWNLETFKNTLDPLNNFELKAQKTIIKQHLAPKDLNTLQRGLWALAKHSHVLRRFLFGVHVKKDVKLIKNMGVYLQRNPNPELLDSYKKTIEQFNLFLAGIGKNTFKKYGVQLPLSPFKKSEKALFDFLDSNKKNFGSTPHRQNLRIERIKHDFANSDSFNAFVDRMSAQPNPILKEKIGEIAQFLDKQMRGYKDPDQRSFPPILARNLQRNPNMYAKMPVAKNLRHSPLHCSKNRFTHLYDSISSIEHYKQEFFHAYPRKIQITNDFYLFDILDVQFQNLALRLTDSLSLNDLRNPTDTATLHLIRARNYAIATRDEIYWNGRLIPSHRQDLLLNKAQELETNLHSLTLWDWAGFSDDYFDHTPGPFATIIRVTQEDTQTAIQRLAQIVPDSRKIAWVNMANAHRTGGGFQKGDKAQEEMIVTHCDAIGILAAVSGIESDGRMGYDDQWHIPPGGNYFHQTTFFTTDVLITCNSIVHAFADFRKQYPESEFSDFKAKRKDLLDIRSEEYVKRIKLDMRGVLRTAKEKQQEVLILSATGCGAFGHDPHAEAKAWKEVLNESEFRGHFKQVVFAIKHDTRNPKNFEAFNKAFS